MQQFSFSLSLSLSLNHFVCVSFPLRTGVIRSLPPPLGRFELNKISLFCSFVRLFVFCLLVCLFVCLFVFGHNELGVAASALAVGICRRCEF
jgi:hypothetical protein